MISLARAACIAFSLFAAQPALAQTAAPEPAAPAAADAPLTVDDFQLSPRIGAAELSPSGKQLAYVMRYDTGEALVVVDLATRQTKPIIGVNEADGYTIDWIEWKDEKRLLFALTMYKEFRFGGKPDGAVVMFEYGRGVVAINADGTDKVTLFEGDEKATRWSSDLARMLDSLRDDPDHILMLAPGPYGQLSVWKANVRTGKAELTETGIMETIGWVTDRNGAVVGRMDMRGRNALSLKGRDASGEWTELLRIRKKDLRDIPDFEILGPTDKPGRVFVLVQPESSAVGETASVHIYDFSTRTMSEPIWRHPKYDVAHIVVDYDTFTFMAGCYVADVYQCDFVDKTLNANFKGVAKFFENKRNIGVVSVSRDSRFWLLDVAGPDEPSALYLYDWDVKNVDYIGPRWPALSSDKLGHMEKLTYKTRDGAEVSGYFTVPPGAKPEDKLPLVVMPHGGPEARDQYDYDPIVQYLATRGYAVFQPNFRGSGGFGRTFAEAGYGQWGGRMQDDVTDGVENLIAAGRVDRSRICIVGASYGGYAALYGGAVQPDLYKCVVSWSGVSDLVEFMEDQRKDGKDSPRYQYWSQSIGSLEREKDKLVRLSPRTYAASYGPPVLLLHGDADGVVSEDQSRLMEKALRKAGKSVKLVVYEGEGHSRWSSDNEKKAMTEVEAFLRASIGPKSEN